MLPVVQRELLITSRKRAAFFLRMATAFLAFVSVYATVGLAPIAINASVAGVRLFNILTQLAFWIVYFGGALFTADSLAVERREGTLGLLFLTDLKGYDVVLGKLIAKALPGFFCLLSIMPMLAIPILIGGVSGADYWHVMSVLVVTLLFSASLGMVVSVLFQDRHGARTTATLAMAGIAWGPYVLITLVPGLQQLWITVSPAYPVHALSFTGFISRSGFTLKDLIQTLVTTTLASALLLVLASHYVTRTWQARARGPFAAGWHRLWTNLIFGNSSQRARLRRRLLDVNPLLWLHSRRRMMPRIVAGFMVVLTLLALALNWNPRHLWNDFAFAIAPLIFFHLCLLGMVAFEAAGYFVAIRHDTAAELILSTRLTTREIIFGHLLTLRTMFRLPLLIVLTYGLVTLVLAEIFVLPGRRLFAALLVIGLSLNLVYALRAIAWCALYHGLRSKRGNSAAVCSILKIVVVPLIVLLVIIVPAPVGKVVGWIAYFGISFAASAFFSREARKCLLLEFREVMATGASRGEISAAAFAAAAHSEARAESGTSLQNNAQTA